jgi:hypothetical protein
VNIRLFYIITPALVLGFYISFTSTFIPNSMASTNPSVDVTEQNGSGTFSSLSRAFDQTIDNINDDDKNSTDTTNDDEILQEQS